MLESAPGKLMQLIAACFLGRPGGARLLLCFHGVQLCSMAYVFACLRLLGRSHIEIQHLDGKVRPLALPWELAANLYRCAEAAIGGFFLAAASLDYGEC
mmetsp:Transcript_19068/g.57857  ORF Transcript_19068/g.57857 Transcript_19068/m.57857 type:complete len:99 (-) Transcript_19068:102-398(-)